MPATSDAVVVGSGPNGLAAAVRLALAGWKVEVVETASTPGGGARSAELTLPGFLHDPYAAVFPITAASPFLRPPGTPRSRAALAAANHAARPSP